MISVVEALPFCHFNICFNMLCFFPDWNHLNCICRGLYRLLINIVTPLRALVVCDSTAHVKQSTQQNFGPSLKGFHLPFLAVGGQSWLLHERVVGSAAILRGCLGSCEHEATPKSQISLHLVYP